MNALKAVRRHIRGQTSVEYLVLLSIAVIITVVAVGVLAGFIRIGTATTYKKKGVVYWKSADIGVMDWEVHTDDRNSTLVLQNNKEYQINLDWVSTDAGSSTIAIGQTLLPGDTYSLNTQVINCTEGGTYSFELTFQYDNLEHLVLNKQYTGVERMTGTCSTRWGLS
jgi:hypothetical protein